MRRYKTLAAAEIEELWSRWQRGELPMQISTQLGCHQWTVGWHVARAGGLRPRTRRRADAHLTVAEREEISRAVVAKESCRSMARRLGRAPSTISRELARNGGAEHYRGTVAEDAAWTRGERPKPCRLVESPRLRAVVVAKLQADWSPQQIAEWLRRQYPADPTMHVC